MAYVAGSASSAADLRTAVVNACMENGWTWNNEVLNKGACYVRLQVTGSVLTVLGGTGVDVNHALTTPGPQIARLGPVAGMTLVFPCAYEIFIGSDPDEVYLVVNSSISFYQWLAFGSSPVAGLPGTGNWYGASIPATTTLGAVITPTGGGSSGGSGGGTGALFWRGDNTSYTPPFAISTFAHHGIQDTPGAVWTNDDGTRTSDANAVGPIQPLITSMPNQWNAETAYLPIVAYLARLSSKVSPIVQLANARYLRIDNYDPGEIITLGSDRWKVYPWWLKNAAARNGGNGHSGTLGWAIRYDGP